MIVLLLTLWLASPAQQPPAGQSPPTGVIRGRVLRADGRPIVLARVRAVANEMPMLTETDEDGAYVFEKAPVGEYKVTASCPGFVTLEYGQQRPSERGQPVLVERADAVVRADFVLPRAGAIVGRVIDEHGEPLQGAAVRVHEIQFVAGRRRLVDVPFSNGRTNDLGAFRVYGLQPGRYIVSAGIGQLVLGAPPAFDMPGYATTYYPATTEPSQARIVSLGLSQDAGNVEIGLVRTKTARVRGVLRSASGEPTQSALAMGPSERSGSVATTAVGARTSPDGSFEFRNVAPGDYVIQANKGRSNASTEGEFGAVFVTVNGTNVDGLTLQMSSGSTVSGRVSFDGPGEPPHDELEIQPWPVDIDRSPINEGAIARGEVGADWTFQMKGLNGPRRLRLNDPPKGWMLKAILVNGVDVTDTPLPFGTKDQSLDNVDVVLTSRVTGISGTVADTAGRARRDYTVVVFGRDRETWYQASRFLARATPAPDGSFAVDGLPPGDYFAVAADWLQGTDAYGEWQDPAVLESLVSRATTLSLAEGQRVSVALTLVPRP
jgi:hypothetical protein